jgi:hypothetical protein
MSRLGKSATAYRFIQLMVRRPTLAAMVLLTAGLMFSVNLLAAPEVGAMTPSAAHSVSTARATQSSNGGAIINGKALDVTKPSQEPELTFPGTDGEQIQAALTHVVTSDKGCFDLYLINPKGDSVDSAANCYDATSTGIGPYTLTSKGTWAIMLTVDAAATGKSIARVSKPA